VWESWHTAASRNPVMAVDPQVLALLDELGDSGCSPEEVCAACPELLPEVRRRWQQMCAVSADLHALFPTPRPDAGPGADTSVPWHTGDELPQIPGYEVEALLGRGGMGLVSKARHLRLNRKVAVKMLITGAYAGPHERARFQREAEAAASLHHANIETRGPGVPGRPVPAGGAFIRAEPAGRAQLGPCGAQLAVAGPDE
jgi:eukaryotic-like serine/threonine-protein kinase